MTEATMRSAGVFGHPTGLFVLFATEACERFSYYGMRALLLFYLVDHFLMGDAGGTGVLAAYGAMVYALPILGGIVADRWIGYRRAVIYGALLLCCGHLLMAYEGEAATVVDGIVHRDETALGVTFLALSFIVVGVGFLKPSITSMVGQLYELDDPRRDQGFTIFYLGINLGAFVATLLVGWLGHRFGWSYGFGAAGVVMIGGISIFMWGRRHLGVSGVPRTPERLTARYAGLTPVQWILIGGAVGVFVTWMLLNNIASLGILLIVLAVVSVAGVSAYAVLRCSPTDRDRLFIVLILTAVSSVFWALFEQMDKSVGLFAARNVDLTFLGLSITREQVTFLNPLMIIVFAPLFAMFWRGLSERRAEPSTPLKFALGILQAGLAFFVMAAGTYFVDAGHQAGFIWLIGGFLLLTSGELCLSPVGLSMVTRFSPAGIVGLMMGIWFLATSIATYVSGLLARLAAVPGAVGIKVDPSVSLTIYRDAFFDIGAIGVGTGVVLALLVPLLKRLLHESPTSQAE